MVRPCIIDIYYMTRSGGLLVQLWENSVFSTALCNTCLLWPCWILSGVGIKVAAIMIETKLYAVLLMVLCYICSCSSSMLCYNQTVHTVPGREHVDFTLFDGSMDTISCEDGFGCTKTLIKDGRKLLGVTRGCGIYSCLGKSLFRLDGFRLYTHCCQDPFCNSAGAVNSDFLVFAISLAIGRLIRTQ